MSVKVEAEIESDLEREASAILDGLGISHSEAIRMFFTQVKLHQGLPFDSSSKTDPSNEDLLLPNEMRQGAIDCLYDD
ncbi:MAG: type II toxin-antitoxin system RelB/DinJ family antitoxin [Verrucomicrobiota bacterium]